VTSQVEVGKTPAGNILTSAAILYTGAQCAKALRLFSVLKCPTMTTSTFFRHQRNYLLPSIDLIYLGKTSAKITNRIEGEYCSADYWR